MKKIMLAVLIASASFSCTEKKGWSEAEEQNFVSSCIPRAKASAGMNDEAAKEYCDCMLGKVEKKYASTKEAVSFNEQEAVEMAKDCVKK